MISSLGHYFFENNHNYIKYSLFIIELFISLWYNINIIKVYTVILTKRRDY